MSVLKDDLDEKVCNLSHSVSSLETQVHKYKQSMNSELAQLQNTSLTEEHYSVMCAKLEEIYLKVDSGHRDVDIQLEQHRNHVNTKLSEL